MKKDKRMPNDIDKNSWDKMVEFTEEFGYMILYLSIFCIVLMMIKDTMV
tara:strand:- start:492 stop:638 length:147 start_codon:yes stop_codon:yes gene_type:complete